MIERRLSSAVRRLLDRNPAVALIGPRQVGKTTLARDIARGRDAVYVDLELPSDLAKIADIEQYCAENAGKLVILDEVHRAPGLFAPLRGIVDERRLAGKRTGHFLLLGSASIDLLRQSSETLAGRVALCELDPFGVLEVAGDQQRRLWCRGGFPESYLASGDEESLDWRLAFVRTYLERDIPQFGPRIPAETLRRFWTMLAHNQGQAHNAAALARGLDVNGVTIARYLDLLVDLLLVRRLQPWTSNLGRRLVKAPKVYVRDSGVCHALLGIETVDEPVRASRRRRQLGGLRHREHRRRPAGPRVVRLLPYLRGRGNRPRPRSRRGRDMGDRDQAQLGPQGLQRVLTAAARICGPLAGSSFTAATRVFRWPRDIRAVTVRAMVELVNGSRSP